MKIEEKIENVNGSLGGIGYCRVYNSYGTTLVRDIRIW